jgi:hypothetical protein
MQILPCMRRTEIRMEVELHHAHLNDRNRQKSSWLMKCWITCHIAALYTFAIAQLKPYISPISPFPLRLHHDEALRTRRCCRARTRSLAGARTHAPAGPQLLAEPVQRAAHLLLLQVERPHRLLLAAALGLYPTPNLTDDLERERVELQLAPPARPPPAAPSAVQRVDGRLAAQPDRPLLPETFNWLDLAAHAVSLRLLGFLELPCLLRVVLQLHRCCR